VVSSLFFGAHLIGPGLVKLTLTRPKIFDSAGHRAVAKDGELDSHYETGFHKSTRSQRNAWEQEMSESNMRVSAGSIFICYRRDDSADVTGRIYDRLVDHFGPERVFMDVEAIRLGYDFRSEIDRTIKACSIVIVVIGDKWLDEVDGKRRIDDENDRVRIEIEAALRREIPIIPVLTRGASHPTKAMLPASLEDLAYRHGTSIRHEHFRGDVDSLISQMDKLLARQESKTSKPAEPKELTTPVKSTQTAQFEQAVSSAASISAIAASKQATVWRRKRLIIVTAVGATVILLFAITVLLTFKQTEKKPNPPPETVTLQKSSPARPQPRATQSPSDSWNTLINELRSKYTGASPNAKTLAETPSSQSESTGGYDPAMATVDMQRIFKEYAKKKTADTEIDDAKNAAKKEYDDRVNTYKRALDDINKINRQIEDGRLSADKKARLARERDDKIANIKNMEREIKEFRQTREHQLEEQVQHTRAGIVNEITDKVRELAGDVANIIFDKSGLSINGVPVLMYSPDRGDMSGKVINALNNGLHSTFTTTRNLKIAAIDMQSAFKKYNKTKDAERKINDAKNAAKKEYDDRADAYKKALHEINNLNKQLESPALSADKKTQTAKDRDDKIANIKNMEREISDFRQTRERQLQEQLMRIREGIVKEITEVVMDAVKTNNIDVVLDVSGMSVNGVPVVIYRHGIPDFTDDALGKLNGTSSSSSMSALTDSSRTLRFGVVDMQRAFKAWPETKAAEAKINDEKAAAKNNYASQSPAEREQRDKQIEEDARKLRDTIVAKIEATLNTCADKGGFNLVFDSSGYTINGVPVVVFARELPDLTNAVLKEHDRSH
jgi:Skp family chaperone for outer membrane proteins